MQRKGQTSAGSQLLAGNISIAAGSVHAPDMHVQAEEKIAIYSEGHANFQNGKFQAATFDLQSEGAHLPNTHIKADTVIKAEDQVNLAGAPLKARSRWKAMVQFQQPN